MLWKQELMDLEKDKEDAAILVKVAGLSFTGLPPFIIKVDDSTEQGKKTLKSLLERGYQIESIDPN